MIRIVNQREFCAGLIFLAIGTIGAIMASHYRMGTATEMGPGYFPFLTALLLAGLGALAAIRALRPGAGAGPVGAWPLAPLLFVTGGLIAFAFMVDTVGLVLAVVVLVLASGYQRWRNRRIEILAMAALLALLSVGLFVYGLKLPFELF
jgi:hypothetical protein